jgi:hypothetical protein
MFNNKLRYQGDGDKSLSRRGSTVDKMTARFSRGWIHIRPQVMPRFFPARRDLGVFRGRRLEWPSKMMGVKKPAYSGFLSLTRQGRFT